MSRFFLAHAHEGMSAAKPHMRGEKKSSEKFDGWQTRRIGRSSSRHVQQVPFNFRAQKRQVGLREAQAGSRQTMMVDVGREVFVMRVRAGKRWVVWVLL